MLRFATFIIAMMAMSGIAGAQSFPADILNTPVDGSVASWIIRTFGLLTVLSVAPGILIMVTSFPRFVIAFAILRSGMGLATTPSNMIMVSLALFMTFYVMAPTFDRAWSDGIDPLLKNEISETEAMQRMSEPFREFMLANTRDKDLQLFIDIAREKGQTVVVDEKVDLRAVVPAFMISEIRRGFEIGFLIMLPFLVIDLIVASVLISMGMFMLPPVMISTPFKILLFVLVDGWHLVCESLVTSFVSA